MRLDRARRRRDLPRRLQAALFHRPREEGWQRGPGVHHDRSRGPHQRYRGREPGARDGTVEYPYISLYTLQGIPSRSPSHCVAAGRVNPAVCMLTPTSAPMAGSSSSVPNAEGWRSVRDQNGHVSSAPLRLRFGAGVAIMPHVSAVLLTVAILLVQPPLRTTGRPATRARKPHLAALWPGKRRGRPANPPAEADMTTAKDGLVAGKPVIRLGVTFRAPLSPSTHPGRNNTGAAVGGFSGRRIPHSRHRSRRHRSLRVAHFRRPSPAALVKYRVPTRVPIRNRGGPPGRSARRRHGSLARRGVADRSEAHRRARLLRRRALGRRPRHALRTPAL